MNYVRNLHLSIIWILLLLILSSCKEQKMEKEPPGVFIAPVKLMNITDSKEIVGQTVPKEDVNLVARVDGELQNINFKEGHPVKKGEVLFEIEKDLYQSKVAASEASLNNALAILKHAKTEYDRQTTLVKKDAVSQQAHDNAEAAYEKAQANVELCKAKIEEAKINLSYTIIKAPFDGVIGLSNYDRGNIVGPLNGFLANIVKVDPIDVEFPINEKIYTTMMLEMSGQQEMKIDLSDLQTVLILSNGAKYMHSGEVDFSNNRVDPSTGTLLLRASFPNPERIILPGQYVKIRIEKKKKEYALVIPNSIVQVDKKGSFVFVVDKNKIAKKRRIIQGENIREYVVVKDGLSKGEHIIVEGVQKVYSGLKVKTIIKKIK